MDNRAPSMRPKARTGEAFTQYAITFRWTAIAAGMLRTKMLAAGYFDDEAFFELRVRQRSTNLLYMHLSGPST
jgi:hypothetical protein